MFEVSVPRVVRCAGLAGVLAVVTACGQAETQESWRTLTSARPLQDEQRLDVRINYGAGRIEVARADPSQLYDFELRYNEAQFSPVTEYDRERGSLRLGVESVDGRGVSMGRGEMRQARAAVQLNPELPLALELRFGAGEAQLELGGMALESVEISTGASETTLRFDSPNRVAAERIRLRAGAAALRAIGLANANAAQIDVQGGVGETVLDFSGEWQRGATANIRMGIGSLTLRFPRELGVRLSRSSFLSSFDASGLVQRGDDHYSPNWDSAAHRLTVQVSAALGSIAIEWLD